jgi:hypothetical protein
MRGITQELSEFKQLLRDILAELQAVKHELRDMVSVMRKWEQEGLWRQPDAPTVFSWTYTRAPETTSTEEVANDDWLKYGGRRCCKQETGEGESQ